MWFGRGVIDPDDLVGVECDVFIPAALGGMIHKGNADSLWRHRRLIAQFGADVVLVLSADAVYTLDYRDLVDDHLARDADAPAGVGGTPSVRASRERRGAPP